MTMFGLLYRFLTTTALAAGAIIGFVCGLFAGGFAVGPLPVGWPVALGILALFLGTFGLLAWSEYGRSTPVIAGEAQFRLLRWRSNFVRAIAFFELTRIAWQSGALF
ncbi:hypothetical protein [Ovoidimarina sediminis]|uniref:hypothetical protein n=1 Tax=Ovoidimarina sediminis TaxID=3079856 RepID=UPI0029067B07|nr:hypothetical protein [Rhodophyticola sp. MJ-SS7]MDU8943307.1 hypothetical protein [Rhodophyticola sp. MJ-SS7]